MLFKQCLFECLYLITYLLQERISNLLIVIQPISTELKIKPLPVCLTASGS